MKLVSKEILGKLPADIENCQLRSNRQCRLSIGLTEIGRLKYAMEKLKSMILFLLFIVYRGITAGDACLHSDDELMSSYTHVTSKNMTIWILKIQELTKVTRWSEKQRWVRSKDRMSVSVTHVKSMMSMEIQNVRLPKLSGMNIWTLR